MHPWTSDPSSSSAIECRWASATNAPLAEVGSCRRKSRNRRLEDICFEQGSFEQKTTGDAQNLIRSASGESRQMPPPGLQVVRAPAANVSRALWKHETPGERELDRDQTADCMSVLKPES